MLRLTILFGITLAGSTAIIAQDAASTSASSPSPAAAVAALQTEYDRAEQSAVSQVPPTENEEERQKQLEEKLKPVNRKFAGRALELARQSAGDPASLKLLIWAATLGDWSIPEQGTAIDRIRADYVHSKELAPLCKKLVYSPSPKATDLLQAIAKGNPHHDIQGIATYQLARRLHEQGKHGNQPDADALEKQAESLFTTVRREYGDVTIPRGNTKEPLADAASRDLFEIQHLSIGKQAPEVEGVDIDGRSFKLSDYRGKVVMLDFWGHW